jgi:hypothetical protein
MRRRLYVVCPNLRTAQQTTLDLLIARVKEEHIHVLAKRGAPMDGLHEANVFQKTDLVHGAEVGILAGGLIGAILGIVLMLNPPGNFELQLVTILITAIAGALFGAWVSSMVAASLPNTRLLAFAKDIDEGKYLMMVDIPFHRVGEIESLLKRQHPEDKLSGIEPSIPAFP